MKTSADLPSVVTCLKSDDNVHKFHTFEDHGDLKWNGTVMCVYLLTSV